MMYLDSILHALSSECGAVVCIGASDEEMAALIASIGEKLQLKSFSYITRKAHFSNDSSIAFFNGDAKYLRGTNADLICLYSPLSINSDIWKYWAIPVLVSSPSGVPVCGAPFLEN